MEVLLPTRFERNLIYAFFYLYIIEKKGTIAISKTLYSCLKQCTFRNKDFVEILKKKCLIVKNKVSKRDSKKICLKKLKSILLIDNPTFILEDRSNHGFDVDELLNYVNNDEEYSSIAFNEMRSVCELGFLNYRSNSNSDYEDDYYFRPIPGVIERELREPLINDPPENILNIIERYNENSSPRRNSPYRPPNSQGMRTPNSNHRHSEIPNFMNDEIIAYATPNQMSPLRTVSVGYSVELNEINYVNEQNIRVNIGKIGQINGRVEITIEDEDSRKAVLCINRIDNVKITVLNWDGRLPEIGEYVNVIGLVKRDLSFEYHTHEIIEEPVVVKSENHQVLENVKQENIVSDVSDADFSETFEVNYLPNILVKEEKKMLTFKCPICICEIPLDLNAPISKYSYVHAGSDGCKQIFACGRCAESYRFDARCPLCKQGFNQVDTLEMFKNRSGDLSRMGVLKKWKTKQKEQIIVPNANTFLWSVFNLCVKNKNSLIESICCSDCKKHYPFDNSVNEIRNGVFCKSSCCEFTCGICIINYPTNNNVSKYGRICPKCRTFNMDNLNNISEETKSLFYAKSKLIDWSNILKSNHFDLDQVDKKRQKSEIMSGKKTKRTRKRKND